jgi:hypothetical protein
MCFAVSLPIDHPETLMVFFENSIKHSKRRRNPIFYRKLRHTGFKTQKSMISHRIFSTKSETYPYRLNVTTPYTNMTPQAYVKYPLHAPYPHLARFIC